MGKEDNNVAVICNTIIKVCGIIGGGLASMRVWNPSLYKYTLDTVRDILCGKPRTVEKEKVTERIIEKRYYVDEHGAVTKIEEAEVKTNA